jgi:hypothetical protein
MPDRNRCQSVVCKGFARARTVKVRQERERNSVVPGGRVELPTPAFSGPRSTGELPRHRSSEKIVRVERIRSKRLAQLVVTQFAVLGLDARRQLQIVSSTEKGRENSNPSIAQRKIRKPPPGAVEEGSSCRSKNPAVTIPAIIPRSETDTIIPIIFIILMPVSQRHYAPIDSSICN